MNISKAEYSRRRKNLMAMMEPNSIALVPAARESTRSRDTEYTFRQDSDFLYLTGFDEPDGVLALIPGRRAGQVVLFCRDRDPEMELWNGYRAGPEGAVTEFGMDDATSVTKREKHQCFQGKDDDEIVKIHFSTCPCPQHNNGADPLL